MAIHIEHSILINRPVEDVWPWISDASMEPQWQSGVSAVEEVQPAAPGATYVEVRHVMGREMRSRVEVTEVSAPNSMHFRVLEGPVKFEGGFELQAEGSGTRVSIVLDGEPGGFFAVAAPMLQAQVKKDMEADFARLKSLLEG